jgi:hypothetical protein
MRTRIHLWGKALVLVGGITVLGLHTAGQAYGKSHDEGCTVANIAGAYGAYGSGTLLPGNFVGVPPGLFATVGRVELDGHGGFIITSQTASFNGTIVRNITGQGTLTVNPDCTGQIAVGTDTADVVFVDNRNEFYATDTTAGLITTFVFKRITTEK